MAERLAKHGYHQSKIIPGLWTHDTRPTTFTLVIDDFAIKVMSVADEKHLIDVLQKEFIITVDREATKYIGLTIEWDYADEEGAYSYAGVFRQSNEAVQA